MPTEVAPLPPHLFTLLERHWGYDSFRPLQEEAIAHVLAGRDSLLVLPTGGGKSLCYQLPALAMDGMAVVISPLIALMKDQVDGLRAQGVAAACLNTALPATERREVRRAVRAGELKLLYLAPEALVHEGGDANESMLELLQAARLSFIAIDEAHCISQWGHDYRPAFRALRRLRELFPAVALHALTATATARVREDITACLAMRAPAVLIGSYDRPNLVYRTHYRREPMQQIEEVLARHPGEAGILYCISRKEVDQLAAQLQARGHRALPYHAGHPDETRRRNQEAFSREEADLIVATVAFGMGIDRSNVRFVLHTGMPKAIENYQQEAGRAGRDGLMAECVLLYGAADALVWRRLQPDPHSTYGAAALDRVREMYAFAQTFTCRHRFLVQYFDQEYTGGPCGACDVCLGEKEALPDSPAVARALLEGVLALRERFGAGHVAQVLKGSKSAKIAQWHHDELPVHGSLASYHQADLSEWLDQLHGQGLLDRSEHGSLGLTEAGHAHLSHPGTVLLSLPRRHKATPARFQVAGEADPSCFEALRVWRRQEAQRQNVPPYVIFGDQTLKALAAALPTTMAELQGIKGIGEVKRERYGAALLAVLAAGTAAPAAADEPVEAPEQAAPLLVVPPLTRAKGASAALSLELFRQGHGVEAIADARRLSPGTVLEHLAEAIGRGELAWEAVVPPELQPHLAATLTFVGSEAPAAALALLVPPAVEHGHLTCLLAGLRARGEVVPPVAGLAGERVRALVGLCRVPDAEAWEAMVRALEDEDARIRGLAAFALVRTEAPRAVPLLLAALDQELDPVAQRAMLRALSATRDATLAPELEARMARFDAPTRQVATRAWHRLAGKA